MGRQPEYPRKVTIPRLAFRFFTGRPLDGVRRTDAVFLRPGRNSMDPSGFAYRWSYLAGWQRLVVRLAGLYAAGWVLILLAAWGVRAAAGWLGVGAPAFAATLTPGHVLLVHAGWAVVIGLAPGAYWAVRQWGLSFRVPILAVERQGSSVRVRVEGWVPVTIEGRRTWERTRVRPVAAAAQSVLGTTRHPKESRKWVHVPRDYRQADGSPVVVKLPGSFTGSDEGTKRRLTAAVGSRLGMKDPAARWELEGDHPKVYFSAPPLPPSFVSFADVRQDLEDLPEYTIFLGLAARRKVLTAHLVGESPHIAVSAGPGAGKSELIKIVVMLALRWGWGVIVLDWKEVSQVWAEGLPGVLYVTDIEAIHDTCVRLGQEVDIRKAAYKLDKSMAGRANVLVVAEEMNVTAPLLTSYWRSYRASLEPEERRVTPTISPALEGLQAVNFGGRQFRMFMVFVAQRFSNRVTNGNADLRESFQIRLLARCSTQTQKMLAGHIKPYPKVGVDPGRWVAVIGQEATPFQAPLITDEEAREFALGGLENPSSPLSPAHGVARGSQDEVDHGLGIPLPRGATRGSQALEGEVTRVDARKLSEMVDGLDHLGITLKVLQKAAGDPDSGFPGAYGGSPNRGYTYDFRAVTEWARRRNAARVAEKDGRK